MASAVTIREYRDSDEVAVMAIVRDLQTYESRFYDRLRPPEEIGTWYIDGLKQDITKHKGWFLVAELDGIVTGYASLLGEVTSEDEREEVLYTCAYVGDLSVAAGYRGKGIGRALLSECERLARAAGRQWLRLGVHAGNHEAREFYARAGLEDKFLTLEKKLT